MENSSYHNFGMCQVKGEETNSLYNYTVYHVLALKFVLIFNTTQSAPNVRTHSDLRLKQQNFKLKLYTQIFTHERFQAKLQQFKSFKCEI